jgi:hypothetical protein
MLCSTCCFVGDFCEKVKIEEGSICYITFGVCVCVCVCVCLIHSTCFLKLVLVAIDLPLSYDDTY